MAGSGTDLDPGTGTGTGQERNLDWNWTGESDRCDRTRRGSGNLTGTGRTGIGPGLFSQDSDSRWGRGTQYGTR